MIEAPITFRSNFLPWLEQCAHVDPKLITITEELPDRLFFEDPNAKVMQAFWAASRKPIFSQPANHGTWVSGSLRWEAAPSCQLIICRRLVKGTTDRHELFYGVDFDKAPWTTKRLDWMARHTFEVFCNKVSGQLTDQGVIRFGLMQSGIVFA